MDVLGQKVVSQQIAVEAMEEVSRIVQRKVTIWDNLHANDYDQTRLYLGPYSGRDARIIEHTRGVLTNPNCEFEVNFVALHTLAQWSIDRNTRFGATINRKCHRCLYFNSRLTHASGLACHFSFVLHYGYVAWVMLVRYTSCHSAKALSTNVC